MDQRQQEVAELVDQLYTMVAEAWGVPLGNEKCIVERDKVLGILDAIRAQLPAELAEAKRLVEGRDEFIGNARREAEAVRRAAEEQSRKLVEGQEIAKAARILAAEIQTEAEARSRDLKHAANEYVDDALSRTEEAVSAALNEIRGRRMMFRNASANSPAPPPPRQLTPDDDF